MVMAIARFREPSLPSLATLSLLLLLWGGTPRPGAGSLLHLEAAPIQLMERCTRAALQHLLSLAVSPPETGNLSSLLALLKYPSFAFTSHYRPSLASLEETFDFITEHGWRPPSPAEHDAGHVRLLFPLGVLQESDGGRKFLKTQLLPSFPFYPLATPEWNPLLWPKQARLELLTYVRRQQRERMESGEYCLTMLGGEDLSALAGDETTALFDLECIRELTFLGSIALTDWIEAVPRTKGRPIEVVMWRLSLIRWALNNQPAPNWQQQLPISRLLENSPLRNLRQQLQRFLLISSLAESVRYENLSFLLLRFKQDAHKDSERIIVQFELLTVALQILKDTTRLMGLLSSLLERYGPDQVPPYVSRALFEQLREEELQKIILPWAWEAARRSQSSPTTGHFSLGHLSRVAQLHWWQKRVLFLGSSTRPSMATSLTTNHGHARAGEEDDLIFPHTLNLLRIPTNALSGEEGRDIPILWSVKAIAHTQRIVAKHMPVRLYPDGPLRLACLFEYRKDILDWFQGRLVALALHGERLPSIPATLASHLLGEMRQVQCEQICWFHDTATVHDFLHSLLADLNELFLGLPPVLITEAVVIE